MERSFATSPSTVKYTLKLTSPLERRSFTSVALALQCSTSQSGATNRTEFVLHFLESFVVVALFWAPIHRTLDTLSVTNTPSIPFQPTTSALSAPPRRSNCLVHDRLQRILPEHSQGPLHLIQVRHILSLEPNREHATSSTNLRIPYLRRSTRRAPGSSPTPLEEYR